MARRELRAVILIIAVACSWSTAASASSEERPLPDYDGRGEPRTTPGEVLLWIPRVILFPPYLVAEYVVRRPLGFVVATAEREGWPAWLYDFFTFGPEHQGGIVPTAYVDFDFYPSVGLYAFWSDAFMRGHDLRWRGAFGGTEWLATSFSERFHFTRERRARLSFEGSAERRPDFAFFGVGPDTRQEQLVRYGRDTLSVRAKFDQHAWRASSFHAGVALSSIDFRRGGYDEDPVLEDAVQSGELPPPPGAGRGYTLFRAELGAAFDNRLPPPWPGSGVRVELRAEHATHLRERGSFVRYAGAVGGFLDLNEQRRVVSLAITARFSDPIRRATIPFPELVTLGGSEPMRGLFPGRLHDRSAAVLQLGYRWPIWIWLDGALRAELGNVFGDRLAELRPGRVRWSGALGVESTGTPDNSFQVLIGAASETFESGAEIDSWRLVVGTTSGF